MKCASLCLSYVLLAACSDTTASAPEAARTGAREAMELASLRAEAGDSFRELGVRKTTIRAEAVNGPVQVVSMRASEGIRLPELALPLEVHKRLILELEWLGPTKSGTVTLQPAPPAREVVLHVAYP